MLFVSACVDIKVAECRGWRGSTGVRGDKSVVFVLVEVENMSECRARYRAVPVSGFYFVIARMYVCGYTVVKTLSCFLVLVFRRLSTRVGQFVAEMKTIPVCVCVCVFIIQCV